MSAVNREFSQLPGIRPKLTDPLLRVENLSKNFRVDHGTGTDTHLRAVANVSFDIAKGETLGLVGESGCGKSTIARCVLRLIEPSDGTTVFDSVELGSLPTQALRALRSRMQIIFQDPYSSLDPRMRVSDIVAEPLQVHGMKDAGERRRLAHEILSLVGISPGSAGRKPHAFSGGQRQRIAIARSLVLNPDFLVLDEPVTALDVSMQAQILNLLADLRDRLGLTYLFIVHDLTVAEHFCHRIAVVYLGRIVELASREQLFSNPLHPYTRALLSAVPNPDPAKSTLDRRLLLTGEASTTAVESTGCPFKPRCPTGHNRELCGAQAPHLTEYEPDHWVSCHFPGELPE